jgi:hypothetical protein
MFEALSESRRNATWSFEFFLKAFDRAFAASGADFADTNRGD